MDEVDAGLAPGLELVWPGKYDDQGRRRPVPRVRPTLELVELHGPAEPPPDRLIIGDNLLALDALADTHAGTVDLVVIDPPFGTGGRFDVQTRVGPRKDDGSLATLRRPAYGDRWHGGAAGLVAMLDPRLRLAHTLLSDEGSLYVHLDATLVHAVKLLLDEIFGADCFQRQIVWRIGWVSGFKTRARNWIRNHDVILFYTKHPTRFCFEKQYVPHPPGYRRRDGNPARSPGLPIPDVWNASDVEAALRGAESLDSIQIKSFSTEKTGYATQKNESLLQRIIASSSRPGDLVADVFCGSGTTLAVARKLGRRVLGCDASRAAIHITRRRLLGIEAPRGLEVWSLEPHEQRELAMRPDAAALMVGAAGQGARAVISPSVVGPDALPEGPGAVVAWGYRLPALVRHVEDEGVEVGGVASDDARPLIVVQRELLDPRSHHAPEAVSTWPHARVRLVGLARGRVGVVLLGIEDPRPPEDLVALAATPLDLVDAWAVQWHASDAVLRPDAFFMRDHGKRDLQVELEPRAASGPGPWLLRIVVLDVLHRRTTLECALARKGDAIVVHEAWAS